MFQVGKKRPACSFKFVIRPLDQLKRVISVMLFGLECCWHFGSHSKSTWFPCREKKTKYVSSSDFQPWQINAGEWLTWNYSNTVEKQRDGLHFLQTVIAGPSHASWSNPLCDCDVLKTIRYSLSEPSAKSCLVPCVPWPVELLLAVCRDQLTPDWGSADQPHKVCSKSHTADKEGVVAVGSQKDIQIMNDNIWWYMYR